QVTVANAAGGKPVLDVSASTDPTERQAAQLGQAALGAGPPSRGFRGGMENFAYLIPERGKGPHSEGKGAKTRCDGRAAMADAIIALTANQAMARQTRIEFLPEWFDPNSPKVPDKNRVPTNRNGKPLG